MVSNRQLLFQDKDTGFSLVTEFGAQNSTFKDALSVRQNNLSWNNTNTKPSRLETEFDPYSHHYVLYQRMKPVGTVTVTCARDGLIDCQEYYPERLLAQLGHLTESASHFCIRAKHDCSYLILRRVFREVWIDRLASGSRLNIVNATSDRLKGYHAMGYRRLPVPTFLHPRLKTQSHTLVLAADPTLRSFVQDCIQKVDQPLPLASVMDLLSQPVLR